MTTGRELLQRRFESHDATIVVIGQGYVGLPLSMELVRAGFRCVGIDIDPERVAQLNAGHSYIFDVTDEELAAARDSGRFEATTEYARVADASAISICVPTPLRKTRDPDISYIQAAADAMRPHLDGPVLVVLESTTYPGTTEEVLVPMLTADGLELDVDLFAAFSPERVDPGNARYGLRNTPKVVGGVSEDSTALIEALYSQVVENVHPVGSAREAELVKLLENTFRAVNIALVNEMAIMCDRMDIDIWNVIEAAATKPFGFMPFYPGPGIGGHCIPLDPTYLSWKAKSYGYYNRFIELATDINGNMPRFVVQKLVRELNDRGVATHGARVLLCGVAYKNDINDLRESPALDIWQLLASEWDVEVDFHDPYIGHLDMFDADSVDLSVESLSTYDAVVITTAHQSVDYDLISAHADLVIDARRAIRIKAPNVVRL